MPKFFYILYFYYLNETVVSHLVDSAKAIFTNCAVGCSSLSGKHACLLVTSDLPIFPWEIDEIESLFGDPFVGGVIFSHNNATAYGAEVASMEEVGPQHVYSAGGLVRFSLWEIVTLKRFFFVHNTKKLVLNSSDIAGFCYHDEFLCFFLQSSEPILTSEIEFLNQTISPRIPQLFKTLI